MRCHAYQIEQQMPYRSGAHLTGGEHLLERIDMDRDGCVRNTNFSILTKQIRPR